MTYTPSPYDPTTNALVLVPAIVWMELKCKRPNTALSTLRGDALVVYRPRIPYATHREDDSYLFRPLRQPDPVWQVVQGFTPGTYVLEAFTSNVEGDSLFMWDIDGQDAYRPGDEIFAGNCTVPR